MGWRGRRCFFFYGYNPFLFYGHMHLLFYVHLFFECKMNYCPGQNDLGYHNSGGKKTIFLKNLNSAFRSC